MELGVAAMRTALSTFSFSFTTADEETRLIFASSLLQRARKRVMEAMIYHARFTKAARLVEFALLRRGDKAFSRFVRYYILLLLFAKAIVFRQIKSSSNLLRSTCSRFKKWPTQTPAVCVALYHLSSTLFIFNKVDPNGFVLEYLCNEKNFIGLGDVADFLKKYSSRYVDYMAIYLLNVTVLGLFCVICST